MNTPLISIRLLAQDVLLFLLFITTATLVQADSRPNIILVVADDLGYGDIGVYGQGVIATPNLDQMASEGVRLMNFYASAPNCTPSRAGLMTGRYAIRMGLAAKVLFAEDRHGLPQAELTVAEILKGAGYRTAMMGKWHLGHQQEFWPARHGFEHFYGLPYSNNQLPLALYENEKIVEQPVEQSTLTRRYTRKAIEFIDAGDGPFFLYIAHTFPHVPLHASAQFRGRSKAGLYGDVVEELDWNMGELLRALKSRGLDSSTLVVFTSDNGPYPQGSTGGLRGSKGTVWEGGMRVPLIARWPGQIPAGGQAGSIAMNIDILPTLAKLAGATLPENLVLDGRDIWPLLQGKSTAVHERLYFFYDEKISAVRTQRFKMLMAAPYLGIRRWFPDYRLHYLFDLDSDPGEQYSIRNHYPGIWRQMQEFLVSGQEEFEKFSVPGEGES